MRRDNPIAASLTTDSAKDTGASSTILATRDAPEHRDVSWSVLLPPIYAVALAVLAGDALGNFHFYCPRSIALILAISSGAAFVLSFTRIGYALALLATAAACNLAVHDVIAPRLSGAVLRSLPDRAAVTLAGVVAREPEQTAKLTHLYVQVDRAAPPGSSPIATAGLVRVAILQPLALRIGDRVSITGRIRLPRNNGNPGEFDYEAFMAREGINATMTLPAGSFGTAEFHLIGFHPLFPASMIQRLRNRIGSFLDRNLGPTERAEMRALVIGDRGAIDDSLRETFARTGMAHLLVISGLHLSFVAAAAFAVARLLMMVLAPALSSRGWANKVAAIAAALAVCAYATIAGHHVSTIRALIMVVAYMFAVIIDRAREAVASLALAAIVICVAIPGSTADIGFQLSFASVLAILLGTQRFAAWIKRRQRAGRLKTEPPARVWVIAGVVFGYLAVSFWAMLGTAPLTAFHFNQISMVGLMANAVVVPIMGFGATVSGLVAAVLSLVYEPAARVVLWFGSWALQISNWLAGRFVELPAAWMRTPTPTMVELGLAYALLLLWLIAPLAKVQEPHEVPSSIPQRRFGARTAVAVSLVTLLAIDAGWWTFDRFFNTELRVTFLSVGQGDAAVGRFPGGAVMLIDSGGSYAGYDYGERVVAPYLWSRKILHVDYLVLSHPDLDHFGGFAFIADNFSPTEFWTSGMSSSDQSYGAMLASLARARTRLRRFDGSRQSIGIGEAEVIPITAETPAQTSHNNRSMLLRLRFHGFGFLFTGDIEAEAEHSLAAGGMDLRTTVLKVPHHGSATSSTAEFVEAAQPRFAVISDGYQNRFHFPSNQVVERYRAAGAIVLRTDLDGAVMANVTPDSLSVRTFDGREFVLPSGIDLMK